MKAIILAAGLGTNLLPLTETRPKPMISICGKPVLEYIVEGLVEAGSREIVMIVGSHAQKIKTYFGRGSGFNANIEYIEQQEQTGIGDALLLAERHIKPGSQFFLVYSDILFERNIFSQIKETAKFRFPAVALTLTNRVHPDCGKAAINPDSAITHISFKDAGSFVLAGVFILDSDFLRILKEVDGDMYAAFNQLVQKRALFGSIFEPEWIDLGYPWNILDANRFLMATYQYAKIARTVQFEGSVTIDGPVQIGENVFIGSGSKINGPCYIGSDSYIGNNVLVRKNTSIGAGSVIGFGVELKNCVLFDRVRVGRLSFIGDSVVGEDVEIGSGIMTVNHPMTGETVKVQINGEEVDSKLLKLGAFIGDQANIGASNTLKPGTIIPAKEFVPHNVSL